MSVWAGKWPLGGNKTQTVTAFITYPNSAQDDFDEVAHTCKKQKLEASCLLRSEYKNRLCFLAPDP